MQIRSFRERTSDWETRQGTRHDCPRRGSKQAAWALATLLCCAPPPCFPAPSPLQVPQSVDPSFETRGRVLSHWLLSGQVDRFYENLSPALQEAAGGREGIARLARELDQQAGAEVSLLHEAAYFERGLVDYYRVSRFSKLAEGTLTTRWLWRPGAEILAASISPTPKPAPSEHLGYRTETPLRLPFEGLWYIGWGGRVPHQNYHVVAPDQRFAYDFLIQREGLTHEREGRVNEDYFCFGESILAPGAGTVITVVDSVPDNPPGKINDASPAGNHLILDHGKGEHSLLAHLRRGSVAVKVGDEVKAGDRVGECGNSGRSTEPHLHYHLQTGRAFGEGQGLPVFFGPYWSGGQRHKRGEPVRGEFVRHAAQPRPSAMPSPPRRTSEGKPVAATAAQR
jgi:hypothetical protein